VLRLRHSVSASVFWAARAHVTLLTLTVLVGCGAKTGLEAPPPRPWESADDAGLLPTFPSRCAEEMPPSVDPTAPRAIDGGKFFTIAARADGQVFVWGLLADGPPAVQADGPTPVAGLSLARAVSASGVVACALSADGSVSCSVPGDRRDFRSVALPGPATSVAAASTSCAVVSGRVYCWRGGDRVARVVPASGNVRDVAVGVVGACAVTESGRVFCWDHATSERVSGVEIDVPCAREVTVGGDHACARTSDGRLFCWGANASAQLGQGDTAPRDGVVTVAVPAAAELTSWTRGSCIRSFGGSVWCWGEDLDLDGRGLRVPSGPLEIPAVTGATAIGAGGMVTHFSIGGRGIGRGILIDHRCAAQADDRFTCWGNNINAQLGSAGPGESVVSGRLR